MLIALALVLMQDTTARPVPQVAVRIVPETVTVGLPFQVAVRIRAQRGARVVFPDGPDTTGASQGALVQALDPRRDSIISDSNATDAIAIYKLVAWGLGRQPLRLPDATVEPPAGAGPSHTLSLASLSIFVRALTPPNPALRVPKPARAYLSPPRPWWVLWLALLALLLLLLAIWRLWVWWRRRLRGAPADPFALAEQGFDRIEALGLLEAGERDRYVALTLEVMRGYLARRVPTASTALTSTELVAALRDDARVPMQRLDGLLSEGDLVKFARYVISVQHARELSSAARGVVREVDSAARAAEQAAAAQERAA